MMLKPNAVPWQEWLPSFDETKPLKEIYETLPGLAPEDINFWVKLLENPRSPLALPGAIDLFGHDCMHIVLGRGLLNQDEAFVIGYSMGNAENYKKFYGNFWKWAARYLYPKPYRISKLEQIAFDLGLNFGKENQVKNIHRYDFSANRTRSIGSIRQELGISFERLKVYFEQEISLIRPEVSICSSRLKEILLRSLS